MKRTGSTWRRMILLGIVGIFFSFLCLSFPVAYFLFADQWLLAWVAMAASAILCGLVVSVFFSRLISLVVGRFRLIGQIAQEIDPVHPGVRIPEDNLPAAMLNVVKGLNDSWQRLEEAFHQQARFTADASHELRTPLAIIKAQVEYSLTRVRSAEDYRNILFIVQQTSQRMEDILETLLMLTRAESRTISAEFRTIPLVVCLKEVIANLSPEADRNHAVLQLTTPDSPVSVRGDLILVERILTNIVANALKHGLDPSTPAGLRVEITVSEEGPMGVVRIRDHGKGIPPNHRTKIFERFFKGERQAPKMKRKGCGLGLALAQSLAGLHRGVVTLEDCEGKGACFKVSLPKWVALHNQPEPSTESQRGTPAAWPT